MVKNPLLVYNLYSVLNLCIKKYDCYIAFVMFNCNKIGITEVKVSM